MDKVWKAIFSLQKDVKILKRKFKKANAAEGGTAARKNPSGFLKPTRIGKEMCAFLGVEENSLVSRSDVSKKINAHVKANALQDPNDGRKINPDAKLRTILRDKPDDLQLTWLNLQRYIRHNFVKTE